MSVQRRPVQRRVAGRVLRVELGVELRELRWVLRGRGRREGADEVCKDFCGPRDGERLVIGLWLRSWSGKREEV